MDVMIISFASEEIAVERVKARLRSADAKVIQEVFLATPAILSESPDEGQILGVVDRLEDFLGKKLRARHLYVVYQQGQISETTVERFIELINLYHRGRYGLPKAVALPIKPPRRRKRRSAKPQLALAS